MKKHLQRIVSLVCVLALAFSVIPAMAEEYDARVITAKWKDGDNQEGFRPDHVDASLAGQKVTLNEDNGWTAEVSVLAGTGNNWTFDTPDGYTATLDEGAISVITYNRPIAASIDVSGTVSWNDSDNAGKTRPESVQLMLLADGQACGEPLTAKAPAWKVTWTDLAARKAGTDEAIIYTVRQLQTPDGYISSVSGTEVTNTLETGSLKEIFYWNMRKFAIYPLSIYNKFIQAILIFVVPFAFVNYFPAQFFLRKADMAAYPEWLMYISPVVGIALYLFAYSFWRFSLRFYKSTGN